jgi:hypothetical protein
MARALHRGTPAVTNRDRTCRIRARGKLQGAKDAILDDARPMQKRLESAYVYNLSSLQAKWFPHADAQRAFEAIEAKLTQFGEAAESAGSVPTTAGLMSDADAEALAAQIVALADRYLA